MTLPKMQRGVALGTSLNPLASTSREQQNQRRQVARQRPAQVKKQPNVADELGLTMGYTNEKKVLR